MNNCRIRRTGTPARRCGRDGQECPSYNRFATVVSWLILSPSDGRVILGWPESTIPEISWQPPRRQTTHLPPAKKAEPGRAQSSDSLPLAISAERCHY